LGLVAKMKTIILSLGGSLIYPDKIDKIFLNNFKKSIEKFINKYKFIIICGGGQLARNMQESASKDLSSEDLDWLGIKATKYNANLVKKLFKENTDNKIIQNPTEKIIFTRKKSGVTSVDNISILIASGWKPGWSTDYDAVLFAKNLNVKRVINMSNIDYVYDKDPNKFKDAKKIKKILWKDYRKISGYKWKAGLNLPFGPIAAKEAQKLKIKVFVVGSDLKNFEKLLNNKKFRGTLIF